MRAILIDPFTRTVSDVDTGAGLDDLYDILKVELITVVNLGKGHALILDDEGLMKPKEEQEYFHLRGAQQPFAGRGLVLGDNYGESRDATLPTEDIAKLVTFLDKEKVEPEEWLGWTITTW